MGVTDSRARDWRARLGDGWADAWRWVMFAVGMVIAAYLLLEQNVQNAGYMAGVLGVLVIGAALTGSKPMAIPLLATPALFIVERVGFGDFDLAISDVALAAAFGTVVLLGPRPLSTPVRHLLLLNLLYQFATLFTVIVNPYLENTIEWFHAWLLISGALIVGWALGRSGYARLAFVLMIAAGCTIAVGTILTALFQYAQGDFSGVYPAWPFAMHKNAAGTMMAFVALVAYTRPDWAGLSVGWARAAFWLLIVAIVLTQSRQALIGLVVAIIILGLRRGARRRARWLVLLAVPAIWLVVSTVIEQIDSQNRHNSLFQRLDWFREVYAFWKHSPVFGHGLRYWYTDASVKYQPPQGELEVLASSGVVGLLAFVVMWIGIVVVLWRIDPRFGSLALAVVVSRIVQAQFDLFWVAGQVSIPFVIAGVCLGAMALDSEGKVPSRIASRRFSAASSALRR